MKRLLVLMLFAVTVSASLFSQAIRYEIKIKYNHSASGITADIKVSANKAGADLTYYLMTNDPLHGKVLMQSETTKRTSYTFRDVKPGKYFVKIEDNDKNQAGKTVNIKENEN